MTRRTHSPLTRRVISGALLFTVLGACPGIVPDPGTARYTYTIVATYPHDTSAFTQGLVYDQGTLYEGTGIRGASSLRRTVLATGEVTQILGLADQFFGEGIDVFGDSIIQLTWTSNTAFVYDKTTFDLTGQFSYPTQGWGITHDGSRFIMSDGTSTIRFRDMQTFAELGAIEVTDAGDPVVRLNELEFIDGLIYANVWLTDLIAAIDPASGEVTAWIDLAGLRPAETLGDSGAVLNGIAYDAAGDRLLVTGKNWPSLFHIDLVAQ